MTDQRVRPPSVECPPANPVRYLPALKILPGRTYQLTIYSPEVYGCLLHFGERRSFRCKGPGACPLGATRHPEPHWFGYVVALQGKRGPATLLCIPQSAYIHCPDLREMDGDLRGVQVEVCRMNASTHGPVKVRLLPEVYAGSWPNLPEVEEAVARLLGD